MREEVYYIQKFRNCMVKREEFVIGGLFLWN